MRSVGRPVDAAAAGLRLDAALAQMEIFPSRSAAETAIAEGRVFVNGQVKPKSHKVSAGEMLVAEIEDAPAPGELTGDDIPLDVRYEDDAVVVLSKQAGLVCHPSPDHYDNTLVNALIHRYGAAGLCNVQGDDDRLGIVHRLDRDTTGLMLAARTDEAGAKLMEDIKDRLVDRHYVALVQGVIALDSGVVDAPIARHATDRLRMAVREHSSSREALTTFKVLERFSPGSHDDGYTLIDCKLFTGRTHQIRVHMNYIRHACVGDPVYGTGGERAQLGLDRQFLHSYRIAFEHPVTGEEMRFADPLPPDLAEALDLIADRSRGKTDHCLALESELGLRF